MTPDAYLGRIRPDWLPQIRAQAVECEARRPFTRKPSKTGTISEAACLYLRAIVDAIRPNMVVEIGTFIGTSTLVLASTGATVFTCDKDNDVLPTTDQIKAFGKTASTEMLRRLNVLRIDLWFFDGRIQDDDLPFIRDYSSTRTVFAFDDYEGHEKGVINTRRLQPLFPTHRLIAPPTSVAGLSSRTTIAVLAP